MRQVWLGQADIYLLQAQKWNTLPLLSTCRWLLNVKLSRSRSHAFGRKIKGVRLLNGGFDSYNIVSSTFQAAGQKPLVHKGASTKIVWLFPIGTKWKPSGLLTQEVDVNQLNLTLYFETSKTLLPKTKLIPRQINTL